MHAPLDENRVGANQRLQDPDETKQHRAVDGWRSGAGINDEDDEEDRVFVGKLTRVHSNFKHSSRETLAAVGIL
ncbi:hypothetical protein KUCAC02_009151 [Chaenocephalus aceratus]|uniref:Uncharacterized protein n=1 Tax=Chaenocephalus aceratus TaxID=36190 RepID=A0ACB9WT58_CHAAC|nr:hypothetical protein KUCAC02_009151 [Chaenocephalus aceratus]